MHYNKINTKACDVASFVIPLETSLFPTYVLLRGVVHCVASVSFSHMDRCKCMHVAFISFWITRHQAALKTTDATDLTLMY